MKQTEYAFRTASSAIPAVPAGAGTVMTTALLLLGVETRIQSTIKV